jgi:hypothetical protein
MTGRAAGLCAGHPTPGYVNPVPGRGFGGGGRAGGRGRGRRNRYYATGVPGWQRAAWGWPAFGPGWGYDVPNPPPATPAGSREQEIELLKRQAEGLGSTLDNINARIAELEGQAQPQDE